MKTYKINFQNTESGIVVVQANNEEEARELVKEEVKEHKRIIFNQDVEICRIQEVKAL